MNDGPHLPQAGVADYKRLLQAVIEQRPSGTRQRLATALGTTRSFISQIANPLYPLPVPGQHLETIFEVCRFSQADRGLREPGHGAPDAGWLCVWLLHIGAYRMSF